MNNKKKFELIVNGIDLSKLPITEYSLAHGINNLMELNLRIVGADVRLSDAIKTRGGNK